MRRRAKTEHRQEPEPMNAFFDARAEGYDDHMRRSIASFDAFTAQWPKHCRRRTEGFGFWTLEWGPGCN